jgi:predicted nucleic acid binding AN1-type Zn finger protein
VINKIKRQFKFTKSQKEKEPTKAQETEKVERTEDFESHTKDPEKLTEKIQKEEKYPSVPEKYKKEHIFQEKNHKPGRKEKHRRHEQKYQEERVQKEKEFSGRCDECNEKIGGLDVFRCKYCGHYFCTKHRIPEEHNCPSKNRAILEKEGQVVYK